MSKERELTDNEKKIIDKLLASPFPGRDELRRQVLKSKVTPIDDGDDCGSVQFITEEKRKAVVNSRVPVWGSTRDSGGNPIEVLLHVVDGYVCELEVVNYGKTEISQQIEPSTLKVEVRE